MKRLSISVMIVLLCIGSIYAQAEPDRDSDGVPDSRDRCISEPGPASNNGCPVNTSDDNTSQSNPDDRDGDGTPDSTDRCPDQGGPAPNEGCPVDTTEDTTTNEPEPANTINTVRPVIGGECQLATFHTTRVNVRQSFSLEAPVVGIIEPNVLYDVLAWVFIEDDAWYLIDSGWVSGVAVVLGGDCGNMSRVSYVPELISIDLSQSDEALTTYCYDVLGQEICFGTGPVVLTGGTNASNLPLMCREWNDRVDCFIAEGIAGAIIDWSRDEEDDTMPPFTLDLIVETLSTDDTDGLIYDPFRPTILVPNNSTSNHIGDPTTNDGTTYPYCDTLLNQFITSQIPADGSSPIRNEIIDGYLMVSVELMNPDALPEPEPCVKLIVPSVDRSQMTADNFLPGYVVQYDSWVPNISEISANSTVPIFAIPVDAASAVNSIDIIGVSTTGNTEIPSFVGWLQEQYWRIAAETLEDSCLESLTGGVCCPCNA